MTICTHKSTEVITSEQLAYSVKAACTHGAIGVWMPFSLVDPIGYFNLGESLEVAVQEMEIDASLHGGYPHAHQMYIAYAKFPENLVGTEVDKLIFWSLLGDVELKPGVVMLSYCDTEGEAKYRLSWDQCPDTGEFHHTMLYDHWKGISDAQHSGE